MSNAFVGRPFVSLIFNLGNTWVDSGVRIFTASDIDRAYSLIENQMLGTLSKKHFAFGYYSQNAIYMQTGEHTYREMGVVPAYTYTGATRRWSRSWGKSLTLEQAAVKSITGGEPKERFLRLFETCKSSSNRVIDDFERVVK